MSFLDRKSGDDDSDDDYFDDEDAVESGENTKSGEGSAFSNTEPFATMPSSADAEAESFRQTQRQKTAQWKDIAKKRKQEAVASWNKKRADSTGFNFQLITNVDTEKTNEMKEFWEKDAIQGRLKLVRLWDQRIIDLIQAIKNNDNRLGSPEILSENYHGWMSRRISQKHRLVYKVETKDGQQTIHVRSCGGHYKE